MKKTRRIGIISIITILAMLLSVCVHAATTTEILGGSITITDSVGTGSGNESQYTITVKGNLLSTKKNSITIANASGIDGEISFSYSVSGANACTIAGSSVSGTGEHSSVVNTGSSIAIDLTAPKGLKTATLTLTNISLKTAASAEITYEYDGALGSVVAVTTDSATGETVETAVASGDIVTVGSEGVTMVATPKSGVVFQGWIDENGKIVSTLSSYTQIAVGNNTITAVFTNGTIPYFMTDEKYIFSDLNAAANAGSTVVLLCNGTLPAGNYTIPSGVILNIPMDDTNTLYTTKPARQKASFKKPTAYRTLTLAKDAFITVNGAISLAGKQSAQIQAHGSPIGTYGHIAMNSGSKITINNGAKLYAWGYITGSGSIIAEEGATVYEDFQLRDYRGGDATTSMLNNAQRVLPMSQYYVQNIEVPLTLKAGAIENGFMSVYVTGTDLLGGDGIQTSEIPFIGPSGMFVITSGSITKDYDENKDRLVIDVDGTIDMSSLEISMKISALSGQSTIDSSKYTLPINGNITLHVNEGSVVNICQDIALLPGAEIYVYNGAECVFAQGVKAYIYDKDEWGGYCSQSNKVFMAINYAPGGKYTRTESVDIKDAFIYVEGEIEASGAEVYTTASGANITGAEGGLVKLKHGANTVTYQVTQSSTEISEWKEIPVTVARLKNGNGDYIQPKDLGECGKQFTYTDGVWEPTHTNIATVQGTPATCTKEGLTDGVQCSTCGTVIEEQTTIPVDTSKHEYGNWVADGDNHKKVCACGDTVTEAHAWDNGTETTSATHTTEGVKTYTCTVCNTTKTEKIPAKADEHAYTGAVTKEATCSVDGVKTFTCSCGDTYTEVIPATGEHIWDNGAVTTPATHTAEGVKTYTCVCGETKTEVIEKTPEHVWDNGAVTTPATHTTEGVKTYTCVCGETKTEVIEKTPEHVWDNGAVTTPATHTAEGVKTYTCVCGETKTEVIAKTADHEYGGWTNVDKVNHSRECVCGDVETKAHEFDGFACTLCGCDKVVTETLYTIENGEIKINTELIWDVPEDTQIIVALYDAEGRLVTATINVATDIKELVYAASGVAQIKVYTWTGFDFMTPVSIAEEVFVTSGN